MKFQSVLPFLLACAMMPAVHAGAQAAPAQNSNPAPIPTPLVYQNTQYGFCFLLPESWKGYTIVAQTWSGTVLDTQQTIHGPQLLIRNPKWTSGNPYQDIPIMIFTPSQWKIAEADNLAVSAAPIGPAELGHNSSYVFALPPRYNFYGLAGADEVDALVYQHSLEAPCGNKSTEPIENLP